MKHKGAFIKKHQAGTGGGERLKKTLTEIEGRVLNLITETAVSGHSGIRESRANLIPSPDYVDGVISFSIDVYIFRVNRIIFFRGHNSNMGTVNASHNSWKSIFIIKSVKK